MDLAEELLYNLKSYAKDPFCEDLIHYESHKTVEIFAEFNHQFYNHQYFPHE